MQLSEINSNYDIYVSAVANPQNFWVQLVNEDGVKLDQLIDDMSDFYNNRKCDSVSFSRISYVFLNISFHV